MACRDEGRSLNEFMDLTIQIDNVMRSRRPARVTTAPAPSLPGNPEPMQLGYTHLTPGERERRAQHHLCMYCGQSGHYKSSCPVRPATSSNKAVSEPFQTIHCVKVPVKIINGNKKIVVDGLLDSGAAGNFVSKEFADKHNLALTPCTSRLAVEALDGRPIGEGRITHTLPTTYRCKLAFFIKKPCNSMSSALPSIHSSWVYPGYAVTLPVFPGEVERLFNGAHPASRAASCPNLSSLSVPSLSLHPNARFLDFLTNMLISMRRSARPKHHNYLHIAPGTAPLTSSLAPHHPRVESSHSHNPSLTL